MNEPLRIVNCTPEDLPLLLHLYEVARNYQRERSNRQWQEFDPALVLTEINEQRQWKILRDDKLVCIFLTAYQDPYIWGERDADPAVYIHRIVTHPDWHGQNYTSRIIDWAKEHGRANNKKFIRMDTWGDNPKLIDYYVRCGFRYLETITPTSTENLPPHYSCISLSLFEIEID